MDPDFYVANRTGGQQEPSARDSNRKPAPVRRQPAPPLFRTMPLVRECPLHIAMRHVAEAAVTQHVLYAEGEYAPRADLVESLEHWFRVHQLVRDYICPASRSVAPQRSDLALALASLPAASRARLGAAIAGCGRRSPADGCPLEEDPEPDG